MPHKKNPDVLEILRANYHRILSDHFQIKTLIGNLISGYNRDFQLTKEPIINVFKITKQSLKIMILVIENLKVKSGKCKKAMTKDLFSAQETYKLVKKGMPFRDAYKQVSDSYSFV